MNEEAVRQYQRNNQLKDRDAGKAQAPGPAATRQLQKLVQYWLSQYTLPGLQTNLPRNVTEKLLGDINLSLMSPASKIIMMDEVLLRAPDLMNHPEAIVRTNVILLVCQLNSKPGDFAGGRDIPAAPYNPAFRFLLSVVTDTDQLSEVRLLAARGLSRICRDGDNAPSSVEKSDIAEGLVAALKSIPPGADPETWWLRFRIIEALGYVDRINNVREEPIVIDTLLSVVADSNEVWVNRARAARSIAQLPYSSGVNVQLITHEIAKLLRGIVAATEKAPRAPELRLAYSQIYLAFRPETAKQARDKRWGLLYQVERPGLSGAADYVRGAWEVAGGVLIPMVEPKLDLQAPREVPAQARQALSEWIDKNAPGERKVTARSGALPP